MNRQLSSSASIDRSRPVRSALREVEPQQESEPENPKHRAFRLARTAAVRALFEYADVIGAPDEATEWVVDDITQLLTAIARNAVQQTSASD